MKRWIYFAYGTACHLLFLATFAYMAGFVGNLLVPKSIDHPASADVTAALVIDLMLIGLFGLQHSVMARPGFKRYWTRLVPKPIERSTYVLLSCVVTALLMWQWRGVDVAVWDVTHPAGRWLLWGLFAAGWLMVPAVSLMIDHFDLFGTRQVWLFLRGQEYVASSFRVPMLYKYVRHPLYLGWALAFWATPTMTVGHLLFAATLTAYMVAAAFVEERDLLTYFGQSYAEYRRQVPMFIPRPWARRQPADEGKQSLAV